MSTVIETLQSEFREMHASFRMVSITHLEELHEDIAHWKREGIITETFYKQNYGDFHFEPPDDLADARSIVIIAVPQKIRPLIVHKSGKQYHTLIPPTYVYTPVRNACKEILTRVLKTTNHSVTRATLPMKLLAVRSGLGKYGKNNLCYIPGMGSFVRLEVFYTDYEFPSDDWQEKKMMEYCADCSLCQQNCPTHCIPADRVLIHADSCLTYFNENEGAFPAWINPRLHHALVGCMRCQLVCPENKNVIHVREAPIMFSEEETAEVLQEKPWKSISPMLAKKLGALDMQEYYPLLERNLSVLLNKES
jgi:epoxyqueuosine reductase